MFTRISSWFAKKQKAVAGLVGAVLTWCSVIAYQDGGFRNIIAPEWVGLAIALATALGVYTATNAPAAPPVTRNVPSGAAGNVGGYPATLAEPLAPEDHAS